jgi:tRNA modification GTPase
MVAEGVEVVIAGPPNAGKSSLLNALARRDVAITSPHAGTTRDVLEVRLDLGGIPVILKDTAGLRATEDPVETMGVARAERALASADLVVWLEAADLPGSAPPSDVTRSDRLIRLRSKCDLEPASERGAGTCVHRVSVLTGEGLAAFESDLAQRCAGLLGGEPPVIANIRQETSVRRALDGLEIAADELDHGIEIVSENLRQAALALDVLTGRINVEDVLGAVFSRFCIGK